MKRTILLLWAGILITWVIVFGVSFGSARPRPVPQPPTAEPNSKVVLSEVKAIEMTLPPIIVTASSHQLQPTTELARRTPHAASQPTSAAVRDLRCGAWQALATDETQTVRYCEPTARTGAFAEP